MTILRILYIISFLVMGTGNGMVGAKHQPTLNKGTEDNTCNEEFLNFRMERRSVEPRLPQERIRFWERKDSLVSERDEDAKEYTARHPLLSIPSLLLGEWSFKSPGLPIKGPFPVVM